MKKKTSKRKCKTIHSLTLKQFIIKTEIFKKTKDICAKNDRKKLNKKVKETNSKNVF